MYTAPKSTSESQVH